MHLQLTGIGTWCEECLFYRSTVEHTYDTCPKYSELGSFCIVAYLYVSDGSCRLQRQSTEKKYSVFIYSVTEPHAMYAIYKQTRTLCVLQYTAQMAMWSKVLLLTVCCLSPLPGFESQLGHVRKLPVTWGQAMDLTGLSDFPTYLLLATN